MFFSAKIQGRYHLQGNVQVHNVMISGRTGSLSTYLFPCLRDQTLSQAFRDSIPTPFCLQRALWSHFGCCSYACKHCNHDEQLACAGRLATALHESSHYNLPWVLALAGTAASLVQCVGLHHSQHRQEIKDASAGAAHLPV